MKKSIPTFSSYVSVLSILLLFIDLEQEKTSCGAHQSSKFRQNIIPEDDIKKIQEKSFLTLAGYNFFVWKSFKLIFGDDSSQLWNIRFCVVIKYLTGRRDEFDRSTKISPNHARGVRNRNLCSVSVRSAQLPLRNIESRSWSLCKEPRATTASWRAISRSVSSTTDPSLVWRNVVWKRQTGKVTFRPTRNVNGANILVWRYWNFPNDGGDWAIPDDDYSTSEENWIILEMSRSPTRYNWYARCIDYTIQSAKEKTITRRPHRVGILPTKSRDVFHKRLAEVGARRRVVVTFLSWLFMRKKYPEMNVSELTWIVTKFELQTLPNKKVVSIQS